MNTILTIYSYDAFKRFLLPAINDADYSILLAGSLFRIDKNIELQLEVIENEWYFVPSDDYFLEIMGDAKQSAYDSALNQYCREGKTVFQLLQDRQHIITIIVRTTNEYFSAYAHFDISSIAQDISIGRDTENVICFDYDNSHYLSDTHARIFKNGKKLIFEDLRSRNGSFINNRRVTVATALNFGDCIDIFGLRVVYLGSRIAINVLESGARIGSLLSEEKTEPFVLEKVNRGSLEQIHHRAPRHIAPLDIEPVKIDEPPQEKDVVQKVSLLNAVGPAISMSLPMLLGCAFMIYASQVSGMSRGPFMYIGLVTAVSSALIGAVRSISNMRKARHEYEKFEIKRNEKYGAYLKEKEEIIKEKYRKNMESLLKRYPSAQSCCSYDAANPELWCKNVNQPDFLTQRLGLGDIPFMAPVIIPEYKFTLADNNLSEIPAQIRNHYSIIHNAPICVDFLEYQLIGVIGGKHKKGAVAVVQNMIAQIAAYNSYTDVKLIFIYDEKRIGIDESWDFVKWLPHVWNESETFRYVAAGKEEASDVFYELNKKLRERFENTDSLREKDQLPHPYYVMVLINPELLENELVSKYVMNPEPAYGLTTIYMAERYEELPNACEFIIENSSEFSGMYCITDDYDRRKPIAFDQVNIQELQTLVSNIANVKVRETETGGDIPNSVTFFEMLGISKLQDLNVMNRWKKNRTYESMKAMIGYKSGGEPCYLDIHEKYHGPHGLVAGTTGSGKSETLQTYILSLAINFSPDDVAFFIIDYKGGGMANLFRDLPHMIGQISNLSGNQVNRALVAVQSEKDRREAIFKEYGVKDIRDYTKLYKNGEAVIPLPHLIIVIDEFAEMKHDEPEFIQEIVSVSRVGRSLGIHLIMATQKPAGSVSEDIWSNSRFKLCLRVQSKQDSMDMLHKADAAYITQSGRCYLQVGNDELYELFQSGYSGAVYSEDEGDKKEDIAKMLKANGISSLEGNHTRILKQKQRKKQWISQLLQAVQEVCGQDISLLAGKSHEEYADWAVKIFNVIEKKKIGFPENDFNREGIITLLGMIGKYGYDEDEILKEEEKVTNAKVKLPQQPEHTQLEATVSYLQEMAKKNGYTHDFSLFLPLLPKSISLETLPSNALPWKEETEFAANTAYVWPDHKNQEISVSMGIFDDPENQRQDTYGLNLLNDGNVAVFGAAASGKSTFLQTFLYGLVNRYAPDEVNIYAMEYSARKFTPFEKMPHIGGIIKDNDGIDKIDKLFTMISGILTERKKELEDVSYSQFVKSYGLSAMPAIVVMIDNYASFFTRAGEKYQPVLLKLSKEGISNGIFLIVSAGGISGGELPMNLAQNFRTAVCLELNDPQNYAVYLRASHLRLQPESGIRGRGLANVEGRILEFQTAQPFEVNSDTEAGVKIRELADRMNQAWKNTGRKSAKKIPEIPEKPVWEDFSLLADVRKMFSDDHLLPIGYDMKLAEPYGIDLEFCYAFMITGARKKGKTNLLKVLALSMQQKGGRIVLVDYQNQLEQFAKAIHAEHITDEETWFYFLKGFLADVSERNIKKYDLMQGGLEETEVYQKMLEFERVSIFIDDLPDFINRAYKPTVKLPQSYHEIMETILDKGVFHNIFWLATISKENLGTVASTRMYKLFVRDRRGIHLGGAAYGTSIPEFNWDNHDRRKLDVQKPVGIGMLPAGNESTITEVVIPLVRKCDWSEKQ